MSWHEYIPWDWLRGIYRSFRREFFTRPRPHGRYLRVDATAHEIRRALGSRSYAPNWEFSYNKKGEDINLAKVVRYYDSEHPNIGWWQTHVRGWRTDDGLELIAHWEPEPTEHEDAHIEGVGFDRQEGMLRLRSALKAANIDYEEVDYDP